MYKNGMDFISEQEAAARHHLANPENLSILERFHYACEDGLYKVNDHTARVAILERHGLV